MTPEEAGAHWQYTKKIIDVMLELTHVAYVEAMIHGAKHKIADLKSKHNER